MAYWVSRALLNLYNYDLIGSRFSAKEGVGTRNDDVFMRLFWEVPNINIGRDKRWILTDKAGGYRKWYLGCTYLMDWENDGYRIKNYRNADVRYAHVLRILNFYFCRVYPKLPHGLTSFSGGLQSQVQDTLRM